MAVSKLEKTCSLNSLPMIQAWENQERSGALLRNVDHVTYACAKGQIKKWAWYHIEVEKGTLTTRIDDVRPDDPSSSMMIWCIDYGAFGIALVEGIDRARESQVTTFVNRHGDHSVQHVAYDTGNLDAFRDRVESFGGKFRGETLVRHDGFGLLKQVFARGYQEGSAAEESFPEYVQRPRSKGETGSLAITFSQGAGKGFYAQIEQAVDEKDDIALIDFERVMPMGWPVPEPTAAEALGRSGDTERTQTAMASSNFDTCQNPEHTLRYVALLLAAGCMPHILLRLAAVAALVLLEGVRTNSSDM